MLSMLLICSCTRFVPGMKQGKATQRSLVGENEAQIYLYLPVFVFMIIGQDKEIFLKELPSINIRY